MKLLLKFNLIFLLIFAIGIAAVGYLARILLERNARAEIAQSARLLMDTALATRGYTQAQIQPLLETQMKYTFLPQSVPAYSATEVFGDLQKKHSAYAYKEAVLNPTNPRNRAVEWETDIVQKFRTDKESTEIVGERDTPNGRSFYVARPIRIANAACLRCHSTVDAAPKTLVDRYGPANGFGWNLNEVIGAQVVSVPTAVPLARADEAFKTLMTTIAAVLIGVGVLLNLFLWWIVIRPVSGLAKFADQISMGELDAPEFARKANDEIGNLAQSIGRMRTSLVQAMKMLET